MKDESESLWKTEEALRQTLSQNQKYSWFVRILFSVDSTMKAARLILDQVTAEKPGLVIGLTQEAGRGRQGRDWESPPGGFYATYVFCTQQEQAKLSGFSLVVGLAIQEQLTKLGCSGLALKWPNDLLSSDHKKLGGILIEVFAQDDKTFVLCGIGINLMQSAKSNPNSTNLKDLCKKDFEPTGIAEVISNSLFRSFRDFEVRGFANFRERWLEKACYHKEKIKVHNGNELIEGTFLDVTERGTLLIDYKGNTKEISSGEIVSL